MSDRQDYTPYVILDTPELRKDAKEIERYVRKTYAEFRKVLRADDAGNVKSIELFVRASA